MSVLVSASRLERAVGYIDHIHGQAHLSFKRWLRPGDKSSVKNRRRPWWSTAIFLPASGSYSPVLPAIPFSVLEDSLTANPNGSRSRLRSFSKYPVGLSLRSLTASLSTAGRTTLNPSGNAYAGPNPAPVVVIVNSDIG
jgi:hypothetical protein